MGQVFLLHFNAWIQPSENINPRAELTKSAPVARAQATSPGTTNLPEAIRRIRDCNPRSASISTTLGRDSRKGKPTKSISGSVRLEKAGAFLEVGGIEPELLWSRAFPEGSDPLSRFAGEARLLERGLKVPKAIGIVRQRHAAGELIDSASDARAGDIDTLWQERLTDPPRAGRRAAMMAKHGSERPFVARTLGVWAAVLRTRGDLRLATVVLGVALELAEDDVRVRAELAQRAAYVLSDRARFAEALQLVEVALVLYARSGDVAGVGRALVDNGTFLDYCGEREEAIAAYTAALGFLPDAERFNRYGAHQGLALVYVNTGKLRFADHHLHEALRVRVVLSEIETARLYWLRARIAQARQETGQAIIYFEKVLSHLDDAPEDFAVAASELVLIRLHAGQVAEATRQAKALTQVALRIDNEIVQAAVANLILAAKRGQLSLEAAESLLRQMEKGEAGNAVPRLRRFKES